MLGDARLAVEFADEMLGKECSVYLCIYVFSAGVGVGLEGDAFLVSSIDR